MIKAILFDIDETLVNHYKAIENAIGIFHAKKSLAERVSVAELIKYWDVAERKYFELYLQGKMTILEQRIARIQHVYKSFGEKLNEAQAKNTIEEYLVYYHDCWELFDDVVNCLDSLKEYKLGVISNGDSVQQRMKLKKTAIEHYFSSVLISGDIGIPKPNKEIFIQALRNLNIKPEEAVYIGDDVKKDVEGAINAGVRPVWIDRYNKSILTTKEPVQIINTLSELKI